MKISSETKTVLKNFASINSNMVFHGGNTLTTMTDLKNLMASCEVHESFPKFGIYDLNEFLSVINMFSDPELEFHEKFVYIKESGKSVRYSFSDPAILTTPTQTVKLPKPELEFTLSVDELNDIRKASSTLKMPHLVITKSLEDESGIILSVTDSTDPNANSFSIEKNEGVVISDTLSNKFSFALTIANLRFLVDSYQVFITSKLISKMIGESTGVEYFVALDRNSTV
jgi:hypothetical protein